MAPISVELEVAGDGVDEVVEIGTGRVLTGLVKRIDPNLSARSVGTPAEIASLIEEL